MGGQGEQTLTVRPDDGPRGRKTSTSSPTSHEGGEGGVNITQMNLGITLIRIPTSILLNQCEEAR